MKHFWLGELYLFIYDFLDEKNINFTEKDIYLYILCLINNKKIKQFTDIDYKFIAYSFQELFEKDIYDITRIFYITFKNITNLKEQFDNFYKIIDTYRYKKNINKRIKTFATLPIGEMDVLKINQAINMMENQSLYFWFEYNETKLNDILNETYITFFNIKN